MINPSLLRNSLEEVIKNLDRREFSFDKQKYQLLERKRQDLTLRLHSQQNKMNLNAKQVGEKRQAKENADDLIQIGNTIKKELAKLTKESDECNQELNEYLLTIPNLLQEDVPQGINEKDNKVIKQHGSISNISNRIPHDELFPYSIDFISAAIITGARFSVLHNKLAKLHRSLINFMLDLHTKEHGFIETTVPYIVNKESAIGTGQLPKFAEDLFVIHQEDSNSGFYLIPTAEVPLTNLVRNKIIATNDLPLRFVSATPCFRSEAGSYGKDTKGLIRQHQFEKVELVVIAKPQESQQLFKDLLNSCEEVIRKLELPYQVLHLCAGDTGFSAASTYDLEIYFPSQKKYREVSSCSIFTDFQARRIKARYKEKQGAKPTLVHTLNSSGLAVGRTLAALLENHVVDNKYIKIPKSLHPYFEDERIELD